MPYTLVVIHVQRVVEAFLLLRQSGKGIADLLVIRLAVNGILIDNNRSAVACQRFEDTEYRTANNGNAPQNRVCLQAPIGIEFITRPCEARKDHQHIQRHDPFWLLGSHFSLPIHGSFYGKA